jgi:hypothetical protein
MLLESVQMLATAHHVLDGRTVEGLKPTHANHPCSLWVRESSSNYRWLRDMARGLSSQYSLRYGKQHKYDPAVFVGGLATQPAAILAGDPTPHPQCMPEAYRVPGDAVLAYRFYYIGMKMRFARWRNSVGVPYWIESTSELFDAQGLPYDLGEELADTE